VTTFGGVLNKGAPLKTISVIPEQLIPTDYPRSLLGILRFIPLMADNEPIDPVVVVPRSSMEGDVSPDTTKNLPLYYICSGNHRTAAAFICGRQVSVTVIESEKDMECVCEGRIARCQSILDLENKCCEEARSGRYLKGGWMEYLRMVTDSGVVHFEEKDGPSMSELDLHRKSW
jgi:hypothetical protein